MATLHDDAFRPLLVRREVVQLLSRYGAYFMEGEEFTEAALLAFTGLSFLAMCINLGIDPAQSVEQLDRLCRSDVFNVDDDPAKGQFIHTAPSAVQ